MAEKGQEYRQLLPYLAPELRAAVAAPANAAPANAAPANAAPDALADLEEIRLKAGAPLLLRLAEGERFVTADGRLSSHIEDARTVQPDELRRTLLLLAEASVYAFEEELRRGYITLPGGHRAGLSGRAVLTEGRLASQKEISSINMRVARSRPGCGRDLLLRLLSLPGGLPSTLLLAPPRAGKTTLLRDLTRLLSAGELGAPRRVAVADERSELAAMRRGVAQLDVGPRTDVLDACPKAEAMELLLRSMGPEVLVTDELGRAEDGRAVADAAMSGVTVLATAHAHDEEEARRRPLLRELLADGYFRCLVILSRRRGPGTVEAVRVL